MSTIDALHAMTLALDYAAYGRGTVSPNPLVGCVLVKDNQVLAHGFHQRAGGPHAEIMALSTAGTAAKHATAYVTLEPCCHHGKTPPCTDALIRAQIKKVVIACLDPNPQVCGQGIAALKAAGIEIELGLLEEKARALNHIFFHFIEQQRPFVVAKWAMSLDGQTVTHANDDRTITGTAAQKNVHELRDALDAILIGHQTALRDNPLLTVRLATKQHIKQPLRIVLSSRGGLPLNLNVFDTQVAGTLLATTHLANQTWCEQLQQQGVDILILPTNAENKVDLHALLAALAQREITSLLVEGGMTVHRAFFKANLVDQIKVYLAPFFIGAHEKKQPLILQEQTMLGCDILLTTMRGVHDV